MQTSTWRGKDGYIKCRQKQTRGRGCKKLRIFADVLYGCPLVSLLYGDDNHCLSFGGILTSAAGHRLALMRPWPDLLTEWASCSRFCPRALKACIPGLVGIRVRCMCFDVVNIYRAWMSTPCAIKLCVSLFPAVVSARIGVYNAVLQCSVDICRVQMTCVTQLTF